MKWISCFLMFYIFYSCSVFKSSDEDKNDKLKNEKMFFNFKDPSGSYKLSRQVGVQLKKNKLLVKTKLISEYENKEIVLEQNTSIGQIGRLKTNQVKVPIIRPQVSKNIIWLDGEKYTSLIEFNIKTKRIEVTTKGPKKIWNKKENIELPTQRAVYCFYAQLPECIKVTGFISKALKKKNGRMNLYIIWDGYPFFHEQYINLPKSALAKASFYYDGIDKKGVARFILEVAGHAIFYHFDDQLNFLKKFWVAQGISQTRSQQF